jgi:hypothetical protein
MRIDFFIKKEELYKRKVDIVGVSGRGIHKKVV